VDLLFQQGLTDEALSIVGALTEGRPSHSPRWRAKFAELVLRQRVQSAEVGKDPQAGRRAVRLPCLDGQNYWMPVKFLAEGGVEFVIVNPDQTDVNLNKEQFERATMETRGAGAQNEKLLHLQMGPWLFNDVAFNLCQDCVSMIGRSILDRFEVSEDMESSIRFLILTPL
jgi:hypothetical protein